MNYNFTGNVKPLRDATQKAIAALDSFGARTRKIGQMGTNAFNSVTKAVRKTTNAVTALAGVHISNWFAEATQESISFIENLNLFTVATGEAFEESYAFINQMAELYGMDPSNLMRYAGNFYQLADAIAMPAEAAATMSLGLTKASNDIASLFNMPIETVFENLSSGMQGMSRAVRKYGMDIRTTTLQQTALSLGITQNVANMSEANRQGLRYITMMRQAANASGDFARTIESPANQLRIFGEQLGVLGRSIGNLLIQPIATAIAYINGLMMALSAIINFIGSIFGAVGRLFGGGRSSSKSTVSEKVDGIADSIGGAGGAAADTAKELKKLIAPFDELTTLQAPTPDLGGGGGGGGDLGDLELLDPAILEAIEEMQWKLEELEMKANRVRDSILEFLGFKAEDGVILSWDASQFEQNLINKFPKWTKTIQATFDNWTAIMEGFKAVFRSLGEVGALAWKKILGAMGKVVNDTTVSTFINNLATNLQNLASWISTNANMLTNLAVAFGLLRAGSFLLPLFGGLVALLVQLPSLLSAIGPMLSGITAPMLGWAALIGVVAVALTDLAINDSEFRAQASAAWQGLVSLLSDLWTGILQPILSSVMSAVSSLYEGVVKPVVEGISKTLMALWNTILQPILSWVVSDISPVVQEVCDFIVEVVGWVSQNLSTIIDGLFQILNGVIEFIAGVFSGDWKLAWQGVVDIFTGIINTIVGVIAVALNGVITAINGALSFVCSGINSLLSEASALASKIGGRIGLDINIPSGINVPQIPYIEVPAMASGGVVTSPTTALIGEGRYDEAVIPLGNSPQMAAFADSIASRMGSAEQVTLLKEQNELLRRILAKDNSTVLDGMSLARGLYEYNRAVMIDHGDSMVI